MLLGLRTAAPSRAVPRWLKFTAEADNSSVAIAAGPDSDGPIPVSLEYSRDGIAWQTFELDGAAIALPHVGDFAYVRAGAGGNRTFSGNIDAEDYRFDSFAMTGRVAASGDIMSLVSQDPAQWSVIPEVYCFSALFNYCAGLTTAPMLTASTLTDGCYSYMFWGCQDLATVPYISSAEPRGGGWSGSHLGMFADCPSLSSVRVMFEDWGGGSCDYWMDGVPGGGTFYCPRSLAVAPDSLVPYGWTVVYV